MEDRYGYSNIKYNLIYVAIGLGICLIALLQGIFLGEVSKSAALNIYKNVNWSIIRRPLRFFDTTPIGVILNRCINDVAVIDFDIPTELGMFLTTFITFLVVIIMTSMLSPVVIVAVVISAKYLTLALKKFIPVISELKKLVQISEAPLISITSELIQGIVVIRNYKKIGMILEKYAERSDRHHNCDLHEHLLSLWMRSKMEWVTCFISATGIFSIIFNKNHRILSTQDFSATGLILSYLLSLGSMITYLLVSITYLSKGAISIERLREYSEHKDQEPDLDYP